MVGLHTRIECSQIDVCVTHRHTVHIDIFGKNRHTGHTDIRYSTFGMKSMFTFVSKWCFVCKLNVCITLTYNSAAVYLSILVSRGIYYGNVLYTTNSISLNQHYQHYSSGNVRNVFSNQVGHLISFRSCPFAWINNVGHLAWTRACGVMSRSRQLARRWSQPPSAMCLFVPVGCSARKASGNEQLNNRIGLRTSESAIQLLSQAKLWLSVTTFISKITLFCLKISLYFKYQKINSSELFARSLLSTGIRLVRWCLNWQNIFCQIVFFKTKLEF